MGSVSKIEWTDATYSPIRARNLATGKIGWHCEHVSEGCRNCYAESINRRLGTGLDFKPGHRADIEIFLDEKMLLAPLRWKKPRRIFVNSMSDTFAEFVKDEWIDRMFGVMALCPQHTFQVLTKRAGRMREWVTDPDTGDGHINSYHRTLDVAEHMIANDCLAQFTAPPWPLPNVWLGASAERQQEADERIPDLLATPAAVRFVSLEPLLGPIDLEHVRLSETDEHSVYRTLNVLTGRRGHGSKFGFTETCDPLQKHLDWIIVGGESGKHARPMHPQRARDLRDQCAAAGVAFHFKQWGAWTSIVDRDFHDPDWRADYTVVNHKPGYKILNLAGGCEFHGERVHLMRHVGKKAAGRLLDGIEHNGMPS